MLTGGRTARALYKHWSSSKFSPANLKGVEFYFGDERCVPIDAPESNFRLVKESLFPQGVSDGVKLVPLLASEFDYWSSAKEYDDLLPKQIDIVLLTVGVDGHIASIFPGCNSLFENTRRVVPVVAPIYPYHRITITPLLIKGAHQVFVLAYGAEKHQVYEKALRNPGDISTFPARLLLDRNWIFGEELCLNQT